MRSAGISAPGFLGIRALVSLQKSSGSQGIPTAIFLHNGLGGEADRLQAKTNSLTVHADLQESGFVPSEEKSLWKPVQIISWLGVHLNITLWMELLEIFHITPTLYANESQ